MKLKQRKNEIYSSTQNIFFKFDKVGPKTNRKNSVKYIQKHKINI